MANLIKAITTGVGGISTTADASGAITFQKDSTTTATIDASGNLAATGNISTASGNISAPAGTITASTFVGNGASLTGIAGGFSNMTVFTSPGTFTTPSSVTKLKVTVVGGGGGGGGYSPYYGVCGASGGGGGGAVYVGAVTASTPYSVTVGSGGPVTNGTGGAGGGTPGGTGGTSSFGSLASATGGAGGTGSNSGLRNGGAGGAGSVGTLQFTGGAGMFHKENGVNSVCGLGGSSLFGGGSLASGNNYGGGGSGGNPSTNAGYAGAGGVVIVEY